MIDGNVIAILFICTAMNHMGLIEAVEGRIGRKIPVVDCIKCSVFWTTLAYLLWATRQVIASAAMAFLLSYIALWLELLMGFIDRTYIKCYEKIVSTAASGEASADSGEDSSADAMPGL